MNYCLINFRDLLHTKIRREETCEHLSVVLGECCISCELQLAGPEYDIQEGRSCISEAVAEELFSSLGDDRSKVEKASITVDNLLSPTYTLLQIQCLDQKGLVYDVLKISKDCDIRVINFYLISVSGSQVTFHQNKKHQTVKDTKKIDSR